MEAAIGKGEPSPGLVCLVLWKGKGHQGISSLVRAPIWGIVNFYKSISRAPRQWPGGMKVIALNASMKYQPCRLLPWCPLKCASWNLRFCHRQSINEFFFLEEGSAFSLTNWQGVPSVFVIGEVLCPRCGGPCMHLMAWKVGQRLFFPQFFCLLFQQVS